MEDASPLRVRERHLDEAARELEWSPAMTVHLRAGDSVWRGALAQRCDSELAEAARRLAHLVADLRADAEMCRHRAAAGVPGW